MGNRNDRVVDDYDISFTPVPVYNRKRVPPELKNSVLYRVEYREIGEPFSFYETVMWLPKDTDVVAVETELDIAIMKGKKNR